MDCGTGFEAVDQPGVRQRLEAVVSDVDFPPVKTLARAALVAVVVVVPAFAKGDQRENEAVAGVVPGVEAAAAHQMRHRVDAGRAVEERGRADEEAPDEELGAVGVQAGRESGEELAGAEDAEGKQDGYDGVEAVEQHQLGELREILHL
jgi:hypothetical protein